MLTAAADRPPLDFIPPGFSGPVELTHYAGPSATNWNDEQVTGATIAIMSDLADIDAWNPTIERAYQEVSCRANRPEDLAAAAWQYADDHVIFVGDEETIEPFDFFFPPEELLIRPAALLSMSRPKDDCDGFSMLICSLLIRAGIPCGFVTIAANKDYPHRYSHVFAYAKTPSGKIPLDASHGPAPGYEHRPSFKRREWPIKPKAKQNMIHDARLRPVQGIGAIDWGGLLTQATDITGKILIPRLGTPAPGTAAQYDASGQIRQVSTYPGGGATLSGNLDTTTLLLIAVAGIGAIALFSGRK